MKSGLDESPPFETRKWRVLPREWLAKDLIRLSATEQARDPGASHPIQQLVSHYSIDARITNDGFEAEALYADGDFEHPIWTKGQDEPQEEE